MTALSRRSPGNQISGNRIPVIHFRTRRVRNAVLAGSALLLLSVWLAYESASLTNPAWTSGWVLGSVILFLTALSARKRLACLPLFPVSTWVQAHIHAGWASVVLLALHVGWHWPNGVFEQTLAALFLLLAGSGIWGLWLTRQSPKQLAKLPLEVRYEEIRDRRRRLDEHVHRVVLQSAESTGVLADFHLEVTAPFFGRSRGLSYWLWPGSATRRRIETELSLLDRYLTDSQRQVAKQLALAVRERDDLDFHQAVQGRLKLWLFAHIAMTYSLWALIVIHVILVHAFRGA
ncbi:MAG: hypothetical protein KDA83_11845 [Planctomycetales bacterium]|nr:hypothetical protein [Planctomycetales bacterium]